MITSERSIDYFYSAHSAFAYIGAGYLNEIAQQFQVRINHYPVDLHKVMQAAGSTSFSDRSKPHLRYFFGTEIERWCRKRAVHWLGRIPTHHHKGYELANRFLIAAQQMSGDIDQLSHHFVRSHWVEDIDLSDERALVAVSDEINFEGERILQRALTEDSLRVYRQHTEVAIRRFVLGSPTYFLNDEMFYGQDRLDFVESAIKSLVESQT
ncbi:MAG: 2-hydroxychromene-2-carboxylate isomerase [Pseudomonadota bacterium]